MADPITDPLGTIIQALLGSFRPEFLAFVLILGYLIFFLYFYRTQHWQNLDWVERFFFGFLMGIFSVFILSTVVLPLAILFNALHLDSVISVDQLFYAVPICFLIFLIFLRIIFQSPLCSERVKGSFYGTLLRHRSYWPYLLIVSSVVSFFMLIVSNSSLSATSVVFWGAFVVALDFFVPFCSVVMSFSVVQLSSFSSKLEPDKIIDLVLKCHFLSFYRCKDRICILKTIEEEQKQSSSPKKKRKLPRLNYDFLQWMTLVIILVMLIGVSDNTFHIFTPTVQASETRYVTNEIDFLRFQNGSIIYTVQVEKTYWISLPIILTRNLNLSIPNPSNLSIADTGGLVWSSNQLQLDIASDKALSCSPAKDSDGRTRYLDLMALNSSLQVSDSPSVKLTYVNVLDLHLIDATEPLETHLDNGSIAVSVSLFFNNTEPWELVSQEQFPLFAVQRYGNITSFTLLENGTEQPSQFNPIWNDWCWSPPIYISPHATMNMSVSAIFEGNP